MARRLTESEKERREAAKRKEAAIAAKRRKSRLVYNGVMLDRETPLCEADLGDGTLCRERVVPPTIRCAAHPEDEYLLD